MDALLLAGDYFGPFSARSARGPQKLGPGPARPVRISIRKPEEFL